MIYFIGCNDRYVKIGFSDSPDSRLDGFQTGNPYSLSLLRTVDVSNKAEAYLHDKFSHLHHRGEWFNLTSELREYIATEAETDLHQFEKQHPKWSKTEHPIFFTPKRADGTLDFKEGFSIDTGRIYSDAEGIARICVLANVNPKDFAILHNGVAYKDFDNDIYIAAKNYVEGVLQND